jgi:hypothetical protein
MVPVRIECDAATIHAVKPHEPAAKDLSSIEVARTLEVQVLNYQFWFLHSGRCSFFIVRCLAPGM